MIPWHLLSVHETLATAKVIPRIPIFAYVNILIVQNKHRETRTLITLNLACPRRPKAHVPPRRVFILGIFLAVFCSHLEATQLIMFVTRGDVFIAADSLILINGQPIKGCKIKQANRIIYAGAGVTKFDPRYDLDGIFKSVAQSNKTLPQILDAAGDVLVPALQKSIPSIKRAWPDFYSSAARMGEI